MYILFEPVRLCHQGCIHIHHEVAEHLDFGAYRFYEADPAVFFPGQMHEGDAHGRLPAVLTGSGNKKLLAHGVALAKKMNNGISYHYQQLIKTKKSYKLPRCLRAGSRI